MSDLINHEEAFELATYQRENSNVARCYLDHCKNLTAANEKIARLERDLADKDTVPRSRWDVTCDQYNVANARANAIAANAEQIINQQAERIAELERALAGARIQGMRDLRAAVIGATKPVHYESNASEGPLHISDMEYNHRRGVKFALDAMDKAMRDAALKEST